METKRETYKIINRSSRTISYIIKPDSILLYSDLDSFSKRYDINLYKDTVKIERAKIKANEFTAEIYDKDYDENKFYLFIIDYMQAFSKNNKDTNEYKKSTLLKVMHLNNRLIEKSNGEIIYNER